MQSVMLGYSILSCTFVEILTLLNRWKKKLEERTAVSRLEIYTDEL